MIGESGRGLAGQAEGGGGGGGGGGEDGVENGRARPGAPAEGSVSPDDATPWGAAKLAMCTAGCCGAGATVVPSGQWSAWLRRQECG